jgi:NAD(P)-dependent dehydrogenase (short-subunit alcohol dehydrogenase family)
MVVTGPVCDSKAAATSFTSAITTPPPTIRIERPATRRKFTVTSDFTCNAIAPGLVRTRMTEPLFTDPAHTAALATRTMTGRNGTPADFHGITILLASPASNYLTGQTIHVDGGFSVR